MSPSKALNPLHSRNISAVFVLSALVVVLAACKGPQGDKADTQLDRARQLIESGNYEQAFLELNQALAVAPQDPDVHLNLGWLYLYTGDDAKATSELGKAEQLAPDRAETFHLRGSIYSSQAQQTKDPAAVKGNQEKAAENFSEALKRDGKNDKIYFDLATSLTALGRDDEAVEILAQGFEHIPEKDLETQVDFQIASCAAEARLQLYEEAIADCNQALEFTNNPASRERINDMIQNMKLMTPKAGAGNEALQVSPQGAMRQAEENAVIDTSVAD